MVHALLLLCNTLDIVPPVQQKVPLALNMTFVLCLQTLPALRENVEAVIDLFQDTLQLLGALNYVLALVCPEKKLTKCAPATLHIIFLQDGHA